LGITKPSLISFISGSSAGIVATLVSYPYDVLRTRLAAQKNPRVYQSLTHAIVGIYRNEGALGFYKGILPSMVQIIPFMGLTFMIFEATNKELDKFSLTNNRKKWNSFISGGIAGIVSKTMVMPLDTIRKRMQLQGSDKSMYIGGKYPDYKGVWDCIRSIYVKEGFLAFFKGLNPTLWKIAPSSAVAFLVFEKTREILISTWT
jgi:solute carrier family 25 thiamine pyrophosphate transporter 19